MSDDFNALSMNPDIPRYQVDRFLQFYVLGANRLNEPVTQVTLCCGGLLISGNLIGANRYAQIFIERTSTPEDEDSEMFQNLVAEQGEETLYIHLEDARIFMGDRTVVSAVAWRGRLDAVDGFFFALLSA